MTRRHKILFVIVVILMMLVMPAFSQVNPEEYAKAVESADKYFSSGDYVNAKLSYQLAISLAPEEEYPKNRLQQSINMINAQAYQKNLYTQKIQIADDLLRKKDIEAALEYYQIALSIMPGDIYATGKIEEINHNHVNSVQVDSNYRKTITKADKYFESGKLNQALTQYKYASTLKPYDTYAKERAIETKSLINRNIRIPVEQQASLEAVELAVPVESPEIEVKMKPVDDYPDTLPEKTDIEPIVNVPEPQITDTAIVDEDEIKYRNVIATADVSFLSKDYQKAKADYETARQLKPEEPYPQEKIGQINAILADRKAKEIAAKEAIEKKYQAAIASADIAFQSKDYRKALADYQTAHDVKPSDQYIAERVLEIKTIMADEAKQLEIDQQNTRVTELKTGDVNAQQKPAQVSDQPTLNKMKTQQDYDLMIIQADKYFASKTYENALDTYRAASRLRPDEEYPKIMANHILNLMIERSIVQINKVPVFIPNHTTHKFDFTPLPAVDRKGNYILFRARNLSGNDFKLIVSFGKGQNKNGGVIVKISAGEGYFEFIVRVSTQYKWFSEDNNWLTCFPEGGDIEISLIQVSYSD